MKHCFFTLGLLVLLSACSTPGSVPVANPMDEEVNVGYGTMPRKELGFAVGKVNVDPMVVSSYTSIAEYLRGRVAGLEVNPNGTIQIRGLNSITSPTEALIVVDGSIINDINTINPSDVQSVEVLKDGSAAIYGSRGANGVVLITTKSGFQQAKEKAEAEKAAREAERAARKAAREKKKNKN